MIFQGFLFLRQVGAKDDKYVPYPSGCTEWFRCMLWRKITFHKAVYKLYVFWNAPSPTLTGVGGLCSGVRGSAPCIGPWIGPMNRLHESGRNNHAACELSIENPALSHASRMKSNIKSPELHVGHSLPQLPIIIGQEVWCHSSFCDKCYTLAQSSRLHGRQGY